MRCSFFRVSLLQGVRLPADPPRASTGVSAGVTRRRADASATRGPAECAVRDCRWPPDDAQWSAVTAAASLQLAAGSRRHAVRVPGRHLGLPEVQQRSRMRARRATGRRPAARAARSVTTARRSGGVRGRCRQIGSIGGGWLNMVVFLVVGRRARRWGLSMLRQRRLRQGAHSAGAGSLLQFGQPTCCCFHCNGWGVF